MVDPARKRATYEDLLAVPDTMIAEIIDGELYTQPRPASRHAMTSAVAGMDIGGPFHREGGGPHGPGGWWILDEPELHLGQDILVPDLAGWRRDRMPVVPDAPYFTLAPDWACEVSSPGTARRDRVEKMSIYAREKVPHVWLVDPAVRLVEVYRRDGVLWTRVGVYGDDDVARMEPFEAVEIELKRWWLEAGGPG